MTYMINPILLRTFKVLVQTGHFTRTAEELFMTQPGVSQHVSKLEKQCGHMLIKRDKKTFSLTEQGRIMYDYALTLEKSEQRLFEQLTFDNPYFGDCHIACSGAVALHIYPQLLALQVKHSDLHIKLHAAPNRDILTKIKNETITLGIITDRISDNAFESIEIATEELCLVVPSNAPKQTNKREILLTLGLINHPDAAHYLSLYLQDCNEPDLHNLSINDLKKVGYINQIGQILEPIAQGIGFTVLPRTAIESYEKKEMLTVLTSNKPVIETLYLIKKKNRVLPARYHEVMTLLAHAW